MRYNVSITNRQERRRLDSRTLIYSKKMYGHEVYGHLLDLVEYLESEGKMINLLEEKRMGTGATHMDTDGSLIYEIGVGGLVNNLNHEFPIHEAISPIVTCMHETFGHGGQKLNEAYKDTPLSMVLLLNDLACKSSYAYYGHDKNGNLIPAYFDQPHEIAAQFVALKMSEKYLSAIYGQKEAEAMLTQYVNLRMGDDIEFIKMPENVKLTPGNDYRCPFMMPEEPFHKMSEVYPIYKKTFTEKVLRNVHYHIPDKSEDFVSQYINTHIFISKKKEELKEQIENTPSRIQKAYILATAYLNGMPHLKWIKDLPAFNALEFHKKIIQNRRNRN